MLEGQQLSSSRASKASGNDGSSAHLKKRHASGCPAHESQQNFQQTHNATRRASTHFFDQIVRAIAYTLSHHSSSIHADNMQPLSAQQLQSAAHTFDCQTVFRLSLRGRQLTSLTGGSLSECVNLHSLDLSHNQLQSSSLAAIDGSALTQLSELNLSHNAGISSLMSLPMLSSLRRLTVNDCNLNLLSLSVLQQTAQHLSSRFPALECLKLIDLSQELNQTVELMSASAAASTTDTSKPSAVLQSNESSLALKLGHHPQYHSIRTQDLPYLRLLDGRPVSSSLQLDSECVKLHDATHSMQQQLKQRQIEAETRSAQQQHKTITSALPSSAWVNQSDVSTVALTKSKIVDHFIRPVCTHFDIAIRQMQQLNQEAEQMLAQVQTQAQTVK